MERQIIAAQTEEIRNLAMELQQQGERCALAGLLEQATAIMIQVWEISQECDSRCANAAAWEAGWLRLQMRLYDEAAKWFSRVAEFPARESCLWPATRQALVQLCLELANESARLIAPSSQSMAQVAVSPQGHPLSTLPQLRIMNLGLFRIVRAETVLPNCTSYKAVALFRYLLSRRHHSAHKEELLELFWPHANTRAAKHSLQVAVSTLRRYLDPPTGSYLLFEAPHYSINPDAPIEDDAHYFEHCCDEAERYGRTNDLIQQQHAYIEAVSCYQGDYFVGEQDFPWIIAEQERLLARFLSALDHLGQILIAQTHFEPAIECYQRLLERDSYREDAHCQLMRCYWQLGRRAEAVRQYEYCAKLLMTDLGLMPMVELQELYQAIRKGTSAAAFDEI
jgi:DNA-binding SARP family transcriptional activator